MRRITGLALAAMLMVSMLAGCGENGTVDQNNTTGMIEQGANDMKNDMTKEAQRAKDSAKNGINSVDEAMQNEEGMIMAAGTRIQDVVMKLGETFGITMPQKLDETALKDVFGIDPANIEEYYGEYSAVNTSADHLIGLKVKDGKVDEVRTALENRKNEIVKNFEEYLPDQYEKAQAGRIIQKGNYLFLVIGGNADARDGFDGEMNRAEETINGYFK